jgi:protein TonB
MRALGTVVIEAIIGVDGKVREARIVSSIPELDQAALDAVRQWEFTPSRLNGVAVAVIVTVLVRFSLY